MEKRSTVNKSTGHNNKGEKLMYAGFFVLRMDPAGIR